MRQQSTSTTPSALLKHANWQAWSIVGATFLLLILNGVLLRFNRATPTSPDTTTEVSIGLGALFFVCCATGALIVARQPANAVGWVFAALGISGILVGVGEQYSVYALLTNPGALPGGRVAAWLATWLAGVAVFSLVVPLFSLFPDGRLPSPRWRPVLWCFAIATGLLLLWGLRPGPLENYTYSQDIAVTNPFGIRGIGIVLDLATIAGWALMAGCIVAAAASLIVRLRRSRGRERQQLKWFTYAAALVGVTTLLAPVFWYDVFFGEYWGMIVVLAFGSVPVSAGIAILKYNLYDIDLLINRTLVYGALSALLGAAYVGSVLLLQWLSEPLTPDSSLTVAASTLLVGALFRPARGRVQGFVDRRFYRRKYDAAQMIAGFSTRLRDEVDLDNLVAELRAVVQQSMQPTHVSVWLRPAGGGSSSTHRSPS